MNWIKKILANWLKNELTEFMPQDNSTINTSDIGFFEYSGEMNIICDNNRLYNKDELKFNLQNFLYDIIEKDWDKIFQIQTHRDVYDGRWEIINYKIRIVKSNKHE